MQRTTDHVKTVRTAILTEYELNMLFILIDQCFYL